MADIRPQNDHNPWFVQNQSGSSTWQSGWFDCSKSHCVSFTVSWTAVALTAGTLSLQGTDDPTKAATSVVTLTLSTTHGTWPTVSTTASAGLAIIENAPRFVRVVFTSTAGGGANQFNVFVGARAT